jgi:anti-anti-sigma regulatory factor
VLRISRVEALDEAVTLPLEGQVRGAWVEELRRACEPLLATDSGLILDLTEVSFLDLDGVTLCRRLRERNVAFLHCSPFVTEQLRG